MSGPGLCFDADQLRHLLPHRWPMLLIDRAYDVRPGVSGRGLKNVTISEPFFAGHCLIMTAELGSALGPLRVASVHASVDGAVAATGSLTVSLPTAKDGDSR
jgi:3-hydroxymyristoyl/3-hydroxydecanoyl-(acyl carrier protein) dehydratase